jgi:multidrug efflux system outer membrane protein
MNIRVLLPLMASSLLAGCAVGPDFKAPTTPPQATGSFKDAAAASFAPAPVADHWWALYNDPLLDGLVADALAANTDIRTAAARVEAARAVLTGARAPLYLPETTLSGSALRQRVPTIQTFPGQARERWAYDGGLSLSYEVDAFGRVRRGIEAARGDALALEADAQAVRLAVVSDTVRAYLDATTSAARAKVAQDTVDLLDRSIRITAARVEAGRAEKLDLIRITALRQQQAAILPSLAQDREAALLRLATLTGRTPKDLPATIAAQTQTPALRDPIAVGDGTALLARRPDVRAAERRLAADTARIGVVTADLFPRITLGASGGASTLGNTTFGNSTSSRWSLGPLVSWSLPNIVAARARIAAAKAETKASLAQFDGTILRALEETERAFSGLANARERLAILTSARNEAERAARVSLARQREGQSDFLTVLDAQRTLAAAQAELVAGQRAAAFAEVDVFRALAGGWGAA